MSTVTNLYELYKAMERDEKTIVLKGQALTDMAILCQVASNAAGGIFKGLLGEGLGIGAIALGAAVPPLAPLMILGIAGGGVAGVKGLVDGGVGLKKDHDIKKQIDEVKKRYPSIDFEKFDRYQKMYDTKEQGNSYVTIVHR